MKKLAILIAATVIFGAAGLALAQEFPDVPPDHWAYDAVQQLVDAGIIVGYPDGTFAGKRAMTRYEFAEALARAIPAIVEKATAAGGVQGPPGPAGPAGPPGPEGKPGVGAEELAALKKLVDEFRDELAALGVDVEAVRRDVAALNERVSALEAEVGRVRLTGEANAIALGDVVNEGAAVDRDSRLLGVQGAATPDNPLANSRFLPDFELGITGRVSDAQAVKALVVAGDYLNYAIGSVDDFTLWNAYFDGAMKLGPLGTTQLLVGRFPLQLTPLTMKFVDPDSYTNVSILDSGNYLLDGGSATFNLGKVALTAFAGKAVSSVADLITPDLQGDIEVSQLGGARAVIGISEGNNLGLTYYQAGLAPSVGREQIFGADVNLTFGNLGLAAEWAQTDPNDTLTAVNPALDDDNTAWNAKLCWQTGNLAIAGGFSTIEASYNAPGYWSRLGRAVNLTNVEGPMASLNYTLTSKISLSAEGQFLEPSDDAVAVTGRSAISQGAVVSASGLDKITYWRAGLKYGLTSANTIDLGWEQVNWEPATGSDTEERYISIGIGHSINPNASLKLLYQIIEYEQGVPSPYGTAGSDYRGGKAAAQFQLKF
ncbi:MAG: S-layer homology domain-containing protein [Armatimonadota bacterium]|nr:S-layer homology domain-containing protein [Armatimonadota bacterium]